MIERLSSRRRPLDAGFLATRLAGARSYDRVAGYFSSSILEVAGEALENVQGKIARCGREALKDAVRRGEMRLLLGTDAASEGLNLQRLGSLVNLDLPWNPSRLEQRKGRIQRIGQVRSEVDVYNLRYANSVEDRVRELLSARQENIFRLFGQLPDTLEDVWVRVALGRIEEAKRTIDAVPEQHPFPLRYHEVRRVDWESCARVLADDARRAVLACGWNSGHRRG